MCESCEVVIINGCVCHEIGCPDAWRYYERTCKWCGIDFTPTAKEQDCCCEDCAEAYHG